MVQALKFKNGYDYLSMLGLKLNHITLSGHRSDDHKTLFVDFSSCGISDVADHRPYSRQVTEQLPLSGSLHSHQLVYPKAGNASSSENH